MGVCLMTLNCTSKTVKTVNYALCISLHNKKNEINDIVTATTTNKPNLLCLPRPLMSHLAPQILYNQLSNKAPG